MTEETTAGNPASTNGRVYLDGVVAGARTAAAPKRRMSLAKLLVPAIAAGAAVLILRRRRGSVD